jgi:hypothetical protein
MANTAITNKIIVPAVPALPIGPVDYNRQYQDQLNNVLRLYFQQLNGVVATFLSNSGGRFVSLPCGAFFSNVSQNTTANTVTIMTLNNTDANATLSTQLSNGSVRVDYSGVYNYQFSAQFFNTDSQAHDVFVWARVGGTDVYESATQVTIPSKHGGTNGAAVAAWNFVIPVEANTVIDLVWTSTDSAVSLGYQVAQSSPYVRPSIPSVISTVTFVSRLPA